MPHNQFDKKIFALLIDADNVSPRATHGILNHAKNLGTCSIRRAYGDWSSPLLCGWKEILRIHAITPVQQFACRVGKNNTDMALVIDAVDLIHELGRKLDGFFLASSDSDFTPLAIRIRTAGLLAIGFGNHLITSQAYTQAFDSFVFFGQLEKDLPAQPQLLDDEQLGRLVLEALHAAAHRRGSDGWLPLAVLGNALLQQVNVRQYGFSQLNQLLKAKCAHALEFQSTDSDIYVRPKPGITPIQAHAEPDVFVRLGKVFDVPQLQ